MIRTRHLRPEDLRGKRARFYLRESSQAQADRAGPLSAQRAQCELAVAELGLVLSEPHEYIRVGTGEDFSPELARAAADGRAGAFDVLVVAFSSRLGRNVLEVGLAKRSLAAAGVIVYVAESHSISGARTTRLAENVKAAVDEEENAERAARIAGGLRERMRSGKWCGGIPYGYRRLMVDNLDGSRSWDGTLEPDPDESPVAHRLFSDCLSGKSAGDIVSDLTSEGLTNRGEPWRKGTVRTILSNPIYMGRMERYRFRTSRHYYPEGDAKDGKQTLDVPWAIVSRGEWDAAQRMFPGARGVVREGRGYPLTGVLRCGVCDGKMSGAYNACQTRYYRCAARASNRSLCSGPAVQAETLERLFAEWLGGFVLPPDWREAIARKSERPSLSEDKQAKLRGYLERIKRLYLADGMDWTEYAAERDKTKEALAAHVPPDMVSLEALATILTGIGPLWAEDRRASLPPLIVERLVVKENRLAEIEVRASLRPLLEIACVATPTRLVSSGRHYSPIVRFV